MDLLNDNRSLIHTGKFLRQPDTGFEWNGWTELFALLFDNYRRGLDTLDVFSSPTHEPLGSRYDETQGKGWNHKVPSIPTGKSRSILYHTIDFLICYIAHSPGPSHLSSVRGSSDPTWWQATAVWWRWRKKGYGRYKPERHFSRCRCEPRSCQRPPVGVPLHNPPQRSIGRSVYLVRRDFPGAVGVEGQIGGGNWVEEGCAGVEQGI